MLNIRDLSCILGLYCQGDCRVIYAIDRPRGLAIKRRKVSGVSTCRVSRAPVPEEASQVRSGGVQDFKP
jgi:hypothetical protein